MNTNTDENPNDEQREKQDYCLIFSGCFKKMREEAELTQGELAEALEISRQSVNAIEKGKSLPSIELAASIAQYFETTIDTFLSINEIDENDVFSEDLFMPTQISKTVSENPQVDVYEKNNNIIVEAQLPGIKAEEVNIEVGDNFVTLSSEKKDVREEKDKNYFHQEMSYGSFSRTIPLPTKVKSEKAEAEANDGVLTITLPKIEVPKKKVVKIKIRNKK